MERSDLSGVMGNYDMRKLTEILKDVEEEDQYEDLEGMGKREKNDASSDSNVNPLFIREEGDSLPSEWGELVTNMVDDVDKINYMIKNSVEGLEELNNHIKPTSSGDELMIATREPASEMAKVNRLLALFGIKEGKDYRFYLKSRGIVVSKIQVGNSENNDLIQDPKHTDFKDMADGGLRFKKKSGKGYIKIGLHSPGVDPYTLDKLDYSKITNETEFKIEFLKFNKMLKSVKKMCEV